MILKIRSGMKNADAEGWDYFDNIEEFHSYDWGEYRLRIEKQPEGGEAWRVEQPGSPVTNHRYDKIFIQEGSEDESYIKLMILNMKDGSQKIIATNTETYLLSDDGKTVDRLIAGKSNKVHS